MGRPSPGEPVLYPVLTGINAEMSRFQKLNACLYLTAANPFAHDVLRLSYDLENL